MIFATQQRKELGKLPFGTGGCALSDMQVDARGRLRDCLFSCILLEARSKHEEEFSTQMEALDKANELVPYHAAAMKCVRNTLWQVTLCVKGELIKPPDYKVPNADSLVQFARTEKGKSEVSCVIDQHQGFLKATPMIHTDDSRPSDSAFAPVAVQTDTQEMRTLLKSLMS